MVEEGALGVEAKDKKKEERGSGRAKERHVKPSQEKGNRKEREKRAKGAKEIV